MATNQHSLSLDRQRHYAEESNNGCATTTELAPTNVGEFIVPLASSLKVARTTNTSAVLTPQLPILNGCQPSGNSTSKAAFNDAKLQLLAIQFESIRENYAGKTRLERLVYRFQREFRTQGLKGKARFLVNLVRSGRDRVLSKVKHQFKRARRPRAVAHIDSNQISVAVVVAGGLGDLIVYSAFLDNFYRECGHPIIHVVVHPLRLGEATFVFHDSPSVQRLIDDADLNPTTTPYDLVIRLGDFMSYEFVREDRIQQLAPQLKQKIAVALEAQKPYRGFIESQPSFDGLFATFAATNGLRRLDVLGWLANITFRQQSQLLLSPTIKAHQRLINEPLLASRKYITIHNGWDNVAHRHTQSATKAWPERHYARFIELIKERFPSVAIVQLGAHTSRPIPNVDLCLVKDTTIAEAAWILKHALLHIDGDSGLVHMARALHTRSLALFGPTHHEFFRYEQNLTITSTNCSNCWWSAHQWMSRCVRGLDEPECMTSIAPEAVLAAAQTHLLALNHATLTLEGSVCSPNEDGVDSDAANTHSRWLFKQWQHSFVTEVLRGCTSASRLNCAVAIIEDHAHVMPLFNSVGMVPAVFRFASATDADARTQDSCDNPTCTDAKAPAVFGSIYNIPAESASFDVVVMPVLTLQTEYPEYAVLESLRLLRDQGLVILAYDYSSYGTSSGVAGTHPVDQLVNILRQFGVTIDRLPRNSGGLVLRKTNCRSFS